MAIVEPGGRHTAPRPRRASVSSDVVPASRRFDTHRVRQSRIRASAPVDPPHGPLHRPAAPRPTFHPAGRDSPVPADPLGHLLVPRLAGGHHRDRRRQSSAASRAASADLPLRAPPMSSVSAIRSRSPAARRMPAVVRVPDLAHLGHGVRDVDQLRRRRRGRSSPRSRGRVVADRPHHPVRRRSIPRSRDRSPRRAPPARTRPDPIRRSASRPCLRRELGLARSRSSESQVKPSPAATQSTPRSRADLLLAHPPPARLHELHHAHPPPAAPPPASRCPWRRWSCPCRRRCSGATERRRVTSGRPLAAAVGGSSARRSRDRSARRGPGSPGRAPALVGHHPHLDAP